VPNRRSLIQLAAAATLLALRRDRGHQEAHDSRRGVIGHATLAPAVGVLPAPVEKR
jgi:hypothetical protein